MRQIVISAKSPARVVEVPTPALARGAVLVRTAFGAVSVGTERAAASHGHTGWLEKIRAHPEKVRQVLDMVRKDGLRDTIDRVADVLERWNATGYSCAGVVEAVGSEVSEFRVGDRVACGGGGFATHAEYSVVPRRLLVRVPDGLDLQEAAFATIGAIAMQGIRQSQIEPCAQVAVIGLGILGQLVSQMATAVGAVVTAMDVLAPRVNLAKQLGAVAGIALRDEPAVERGRQITGGRGYDVIIITAATASSEPARLACALARDRGRIVVVGDVGLELDRQVMYEKELDLRLSRSYGPGRYDEAYEVAGQDYPYSYVRWTEQRNMESVVALAALGRIRIKPLITHSFDIDEAERAYATIVKPEAVPPLGVVLAYPRAVSMPEFGQTLELTDAPGGAGSGEAGVALIGVGGFARSVLLPALRRTRWTPVMIISSTGPGAVQLGRKYGFAQAGTDIQAALDDKRVQAVCIANRHRSHASLVARALRAGKAVFVEKPLATNLEDFRMVCAAYEETQGFVMVGFNRRFAPLTRRLRDFFGASHGPLVMSLRVNAGAQSGHWSQTSDEGGRIIGEACHFVDLLAHLAGAPIRSIHAQSAPLQAGQIEENVVATLSFADGSVATLNYNALGDPALPKEHLEVFGDGRVTVLDDFKRLSMVAKGSRQEVSAAQDKGHAEEINRFIEALLQNGVSPVPFVEAAQATLATLAIVESCRTGRTIEFSRESILK